MFAGRGRFAGLWRTRRHARRDDAGSMPLALLVTLVSVTLSAGLSGGVVGQLRDTKREGDRIAAINAAQAGLDAGLAKIRSAFDATGGQLSKLPCSALPQGLLTAGASSTGTAPTFNTSIGYFLVDPSSSIEALRPIGDLSNLNGLVITNLTTPLTGLIGNTVTLATGGTAPVTDQLSNTLNAAVGCVNGVLTQVPIYGLLRSVGKIGGTTRILYATYKFRNLNETIPGGKLVIQPTTATSPLCIGAHPDLLADASDPIKVTPFVEKPVQAIACSSAFSRVKFIYPKNLSLQLSDSLSVKNPYGLCITAPLIQAAGLAVTFEPCSATSNYLQQWDYDVNRQTYYGAVMKTVSGSLIPQRSVFCLGMDTYNPIGGKIVLKTGGDCGTANVSGKSFQPDNTVGAGGAGIESSQYVNKDEVGNCLDLTNENPNTNNAMVGQGYPLALISYPCKQSLNGLPYWNHVWVGPLTKDMIKDNVTSAAGIVYTTQPGPPAKNWCLDTPGASGGYVWVALCNASDPDQQWTVYGATDLTTEAYRMVDRYGRCLEAAGFRGNGSAYKYVGKWSLIMASTCNGTAYQKWNAPTSLDPGPLKSIQER